MTSHRPLHVAGHDLLPSTRVKASRLALATSLLFAVLAAAPAVEAAAPHAASPAQCVFDTYVPRAVEAYYAEDIIGFGGSKVLRGAQLYVPAREGLSKEWLEVSVRRAFATPAEQAPGCLPKVRNVEISVSSGGVGFWINLFSPNAAPTLLRWAQSKVVR